MIHRASSLGGCLKAQCAAALGMKPIPVDDASQLRMNEGQLHEDDVIARLTADGYTVTRQQEEVVLFSGYAWKADKCSEAPRVVGHLDGVLNGDPFTPLGSRVLEVKSMGRDAFKEFKAKGWETPGLVQRYKWQLSCYMLATGLEALVVAKNRDNGELWQMGVELPFHSLKEVTERIAYIEDHVARGELPDECPHDWFCPYKYLCSTKPNEEVAELGSDSDEFSPSQVEYLAGYVELGRQIKVLEDTRAALRPQVEELAGRTASGYRVQLVTQQIKEKVVPASTRTMLRVTKLEDGED